MLGPLGLPPSFEARILVRPDGCWEWTGHIAYTGYGSATDPRTTKTRQVHRIVYELLVGPIPPGYWIDHLCRVRPCVNPEHLEAVTPGENIRRAVRDHCIHGHPYTEENTYRAPKTGYRQCLTCMRARERGRTEARRRAKALANERGSSC